MTYLYHQYIRNIKKLKIKIFLSNMQYKINKLRRVFYLYMSFFYLACGKI